MYGNLPPIHLQQYKKEQMGLKPKLTLHSVNSVSDNAQKHMECSHTYVGKHICTLAWNGRVHEHASTVHVILV